MKRILSKKSVKPQLERFVKDINDILDSTRERISIDDSKIRTSDTDISIHFTFYAKIRGIKFYTYKGFSVSYDARTVILTLDDIDGFFPDELNFEERFRRWIDDTYTEILRQKGSRALANRIHQELVAAVWHPRRVGRLLELGGWDAIEGL